MNEQTTNINTKPTANQAAGLKNANNPTAKASCPLAVEKLQIIPVRYALVEADKKVTSNLKLKNRPTGLRFLRNGWLYIYDNKSQLFYEYSIQKGQLWANTFKGPRLNDNPLDDNNDDTRVATSNSRRLIFEKTGRVLDISYSEVQWSARKCNTIIDNPTLRKERMQQVVLDGVDCSHQNQHLFTKEKANQCLAEYAEKPTDIRYQEDKKPYTWSDPQEGLSYVGVSITPHYWHNAPSSYLESQLSEEVMQQQNYLYVAVEDYLGIFRDLANEQDLVLEKLEQWANKDNNDFRLLMANYVETILAYSDENAAKLALSDQYWDLTTEQRLAIYEYLEASNKLLDAISDNGTKDITLEDVAGGMVTIPASYDRKESSIIQEARQNVIEKHNKVKTLLADKYILVQDDITQLRVNQNTLRMGEGLAARGINDLVDLKTMRKFKQQHEEQHTRWAQRLNDISEDRLALYTKGLFQKSAWYFDKDHKDQLIQALQTELACVRDLCRTDEHLTKLQAFLANNAQYVIPAFYTIDSEKTFKTVQKLAKTINSFISAIGGVAKAIDRQTAFNKLINDQHWAYSVNLPKTAQAFQNLIDSVYIPAIMKGQMELIQALIDDGKNTQNAFQEFLNKTNPAMRMLFMQGISDGFDITTAQPESITRLKQLFKDYTQVSIKLESINSDITAYRQSIYETPANDPNRSIKKSVYEGLKAERNSLLALRNTLIQEVSMMIAPAGESTSFVGIRLNGTNAITIQQLRLFMLEAEAVKAGAIRGYGVEGNFKQAMHKSRLVAGLFIAQLYITYQTIKHYNKLGEQTTLKDKIGLGGAVAGALGSGISLSQSVFTSMISKTMETIAVEAETLLVQGKVAGQFASKLGKISILFGGASSILGSLAGAGLIFTSWGRWNDALHHGSTGEKISATTAMLGTMGMTATSGLTAIKAGADGLMLKATANTLIKARMAKGMLTTAKSARAMAWAVRGASYLRAAAVFNPIGLGFTVLSIAGELAFNYYHLSDEQRWFEHFCWGNKGATTNWDIATSNQELAEAFLLPYIEDKGVVSNERILHLVLTGQNQLDQRNISWWATYGNRYQPQANIGETIKDTAFIVDTAPLTIGFKIPWTTALGRLQMRLIYQPDIANKPLRQDKGYVYFDILLGNKPRQQKIVPQSQADHTFDRGIASEQLTLGQLL